MVQSDGRGGQLKRFALKIVDAEGYEGWYRFQVNPAQYKHSQPQRVTIFKTKSNIITEDFGRDIETIQFSGTTGFARDAEGKTGQDRLRALKTFLNSYGEQGGNGNRSKFDLTFYNFTDDEYFVVHLAPEALVVERSVDQPLLYTYTISLVVLRAAGEPAERDKANPEIGNQRPSVGARAFSATPQSAINTFAGTTAVNPAGTQGAYQYGIDELKTLIGYGG